VLSFEAEAMKPDRRIYDAAIQRAGVPADRIFFVDDREENVAGARAAGIDAVQFVDCDTLIADLRKRNIQEI
jgi:HAD superfamily hydrolase (TIGR01509 family)